MCLTHGIYLVEECGKCGTRFRSRRHQFLRPFADSRCGNPQGPRQYCRQSLNDNDVSPAPPDVISVARKIDTALARNPATILGSTTSAEQYLAELRSMTVILLHIATRNPPGYFEQWATKLRKEAESRTSEHRGPRWGLRPPRGSPSPRGIPRGSRSNSGFHEHRKRVEKAGPMARSGTWRSRRAQRMDKKSHHSIFNCG